MMKTILFSDIVFGPVQSRRLGKSLGINLLPVDGKVCSFDCIYCECGYNADGKSQETLPSRLMVKEALDSRLKQILLKKESIDSITFAGNGEPTLHPEFNHIIDDTILLRNNYFPKAEISVLSNATMIWNDDVFRALNKVDNNILKLDSVFDDKMRIINQPNSPSFNISSLTEQLKFFNGNLIIQIMLIQGSHEGEIIDNTSEQEINILIGKLKEIKPKKVMIYTIERNTPSSGLDKVPLDKLFEVAKKIEVAGFVVSVSG